MNHMLSAVFAGQSHLDCFFTSSSPNAIVAETEKRFSKPNLHQKNAFFRRLRLVLLQRVPPLLLNGQDCPCLERHERRLHPYRLRQRPAAVLLFQPSEAANYTYPQRTHLSSYDLTVATITHQVLAVSFFVQNVSLGKRSY